MRSLYEIGSDMERIDALLDEVEGDLSKAESVMPEVHSYLAGLGEEEAAKLDGYCLYLRKLETEEAAAKEEAERWQKKAKARAGRREYLLGQLKAHLERTGRTKVTTATGRVIALQANGGKQPIEVDDAQAHDAYQGPYYPAVELAYRFNRDAVRALLEQGEQLPFAKLLPRTTRLSIK